MPKLKRAEFLVQVRDTVGMAMQNFVRDGYNPVPNQTGSTGEGEPHG